MAATNLKPRLLRETAEIALTELKRFIEPELMERFSLRRVSAPLFLPVSSALLDPRYPGVRISLAGISEEVEIVGSLDVWLRGQLARYDIAPGFGVFTIMNALRPELALTDTSSPHIATWAWQQSLDAGSGDAEALAKLAHNLYAILVRAEKMVLGKFPHLSATLPKNLDVADEDEMSQRFPGYGYERCIDEYLRPDCAECPDRQLRDGKQKHRAALFVKRSAGQSGLRGELWVWNRRLTRPLHIADLAVWNADDVARASVGGNIYRDYLALQLLHQNRLLV